MSTTKRITRITTSGKADDIKVRFGHKIGRLRKLQGISQEELGFRANLHATHISMIERGVKNLSLETVEKLSNALGISLPLLFNDNYRLNTKEEALLTEINGILKKQNEKTLLFIRNIIKESLIWLKKK